MPYSVASCLAKTTLIAPDKSRSNNALISGDLLKGASGGAHTLSIKKSPTNGIGRALEAHSNLALQGSTFPGTILARAMVFKEIVAISRAKLKRLSPRARCMD